ncbi:hypothetical protein EON73_03520 [bacterium]|nr:MAG: hypothetical protein EON73_03520 [bacterium]
MTQVRFLSEILVLILWFFFFYDLIFNNLILNYTLIYLRYYSLFKVIYISYKFMATKQNLILDYYGYSLMYPGFIENSFFMNFDDFDHKNLKEESSKYISGVILEKTKYVSRYLGNTAEMPYFKRLRR